MKITKLAIAAWLALAAVAVPAARAAVSAARAAVPAARAAVAVPAARAAVAALAAGAAARTPGPAPGPDVRRACPAPPVGRAACLALERTNVVSYAGLVRDAAPAGYGPAALRSAYNLTRASARAGLGRTVAVVDAYNDPDAAANLAVYRAQYRLPACTTASGCLRVVNQEGAASPLPAAAGTSGWGQEESLDLDMVSAICPRCHIILVEANGDAAGSLGTAVNAAVSLGARFVSNSYGFSESPSETADDAAYYDHPGVAVVAASGDGGYGVTYPAASPQVIAVGGTTLARSRNARGWRETVWDQFGATGSGCSAHEPKPAWQSDAGCARRTDNDVAADANPNTGVAVYDTYGGNRGWEVFGGTSVGAPVIAATYALAGTPAAGSDPARFPYEHASRLYDVTSGNDGSCGGSYLCTAKAGYDGPTGWGTPDGTGAFAAVGRPAAPTGAITSRLPGLCLDDWHGGTAVGNKIDIYRCHHGRAQIWSVAPVPGGVVQISLARAAGGRCVGVPGGRTAVGTPVVLERCGSAGQAWRVRRHGHLVSPRSGLCLTDPGAGPGGTPLDMTRCADTPSEHWNLP